MTDMVTGRQKLAVDRATVVFQNLTDDVIEQIGRRPTASGSTAGVYRLKNTPPPPATHQPDFGFDMFNEIYSGNPYE